MSSTMWGQNPTILSCGHLADPMSGFRSSNGIKYRECFTCARESERNRWQSVVAVAHDIDCEEDES